MCSVSVGMNFGCKTNTGKALVNCRLRCVLIKSLLSVMIFMMETDVAISQTPTPVFRLIVASNFIKLTFIQHI